MSSAAPTHEDWAIARVLARKRSQFVLWMIANGKCLSREDFHRDFDIDEREFPLDDILETLKVEGFIGELDGAFSLQKLGEEAIRWMDDGPSEDDLKKKTEVTGLAVGATDPGDAPEAERPLQPERPSHRHPQHVAAERAASDSPGGPSEPRRSRERQVATLPRDFTRGTGRRKTAVAQVRVYEGIGAFLVNGLEVDHYFTTIDQRQQAKFPLVATLISQRVDVRVKVEGSGKNSQAGAVQLGLARALMLFRPDLEPVLREHDLLTRDSRKVERKKYGHKKARRSFQFSKR
jgi:small subunit ribosomal protein S9